MPAAVCQLLYWTTVLFKVLYCEIKNVFCFLFMYYLCEKYYKPMTVQYYIADGVSWVPRLTLLDLQTRSWKATCSYVGDLLYHVSLASAIPRDGSPNWVLLLVLPSCHFISEGGQVEGCSWHKVLGLVTSHRACCGMEVGLSFPTVLGLLLICWLPAQKTYIYPNPHLLTVDF